MKQFSYCYESSIRFSTPVSAHSWLLRCMPRTEPFQLTQQCRMQVCVTLGDGTSLPVPVSHGRDGFGNALQTGHVAREHVCFSIISEGTVRQTPYRICGTAHGMYLEDTVLTQVGPEMERFARQHCRRMPVSCSLPHGAVLDRALSLCSAVHGHMNYVTGVTTVTTTARQAFLTGQGVCQDYAHVLIALLRSCGIPARYACGYLSGEGATHAWVEFFDEGVWRALDPTNDRLLNYGCIKVAHGRDSADCPVNRGIFLGGAAQQNTLAIRVEEL